MNEDEDWLLDATAFFSSLHRTVIMGLADCSCLSLIRFYTSIGKFQLSSGADGGEIDIQVKFIEPC